MITVERSTDFADLLKALLEASKKFDHILKNTNNPLYNKKYADLSSIIEATEPALSEQGLKIIQFPLTYERSAGITTILLHSSGQYFQSTLLLSAEGKGKDNTVRFDAQTQGGAITYARRYAYKSLLGLSEEDDDGNNLIGAPESGQPPAPKTPRSIPRDKAEAPNADFRSQLKARATNILAQLTEAGLQPPPGGALGSKVRDYLARHAGVANFVSITDNQYDAALKSLETVDIKTALGLVDQVPKEAKA